MTAQVHEKLILEGKATSMAYCPPIPENHPRIVLRTEPGPGGIVISTACWRKYIGTWELKDGQFYLVNITGRYKILGNGPVLADWFSGVLRIPDGELLHYVHMGFGSVYEFETHLKIEKGVVVDERKIDNRTKDVNAWDLGLNNLPGSENRFDGDDL